MMLLGRVRVPLVLGVMGASLLGFGQTSSVAEISLDQYLQAHPWDSTKSGPLMVVDPASAVGVSGSSDISGFKRQVAPCGTLTALTPDSMVVLDGSLNAPLDFYDGLTRRDKILLLMSMLTSNQWKLAASFGLGQQDLTGDQRPVFLSIVPNRMSVVYSKVSPDGSSLLPFDRKQLMPIDIARIRLHFCRQLAVQVRHGDGGGFFTEVGQVQDRHTPGDVVALPDEFEENESMSVFGISVRKVAPNFLKRSDLYYDGPQFNPLLTLSPTTTVGEVLSKISGLVGLNLAADGRAALKPVEFFGDTARSGDVLKALSISLTGTFRKVGERYLLTSDIEGLGTRQVRVSAYAENLERSLVAKRSEWRAQTARSGNIQKVVYSTTDTLAPTVNNVTSLDTVSVGQLAVSWKGVLERKSQTLDQAPDLNHLKLAERIRWNFLLPDGTPLEWGGSFPISGFRPESVVSPVLAQSQDSPMPDTDKAAILRFDDAQTGTALIDQVKGLGFTELWFQTGNPVSLRAAIAVAGQRGIKSRLLVRPWEFWPRSDPKSLELNILGENPMQASQHQFRSDVWPQLSQTFGTPRFERLPIISPVADEVQARWNALRVLGTMPGLQGVVVVDSEPAGYEPYRYSGDNDLFGAGIASIADLGYTDQERLQFFDKYGVDPIDLVQDSEMVPIDFSVPMFSSTVSSSPDLLAAWDQLRAANNLTQVESLLDGISVPILMEPRRYTKHLVPSGVTFVEPLILGQGMPHSDPIYDLQNVDLGDGVPIFKIGPNQSAAEIASNKKNLATPRRRNLVAFDLTGIPIASIKDALIPYLPSKKASQDVKPHHN